MRTKRKVFLSLISTVLTLAMLACFPLSVGANEAEQSVPEGTAINNATELAALNGKTEGEYYLATNITAEGTIESFSGTLDGNGKTVTVSAPLFGTFSGTLKNLTVEGSVTTSVTVSDVAYASPVVCVAKSGSSFDNIVNNANAEFDTAASSVAGIVAICNDTTGTVTISNCVNNGTINCSQSVYVGGIAGYIACGVTLSDCENTVAITGMKGSAYAGGIISRTGKVGNLVERCKNSGEINGTIVASMVAYMGEGCRNEIKYCINSGNITQIDAEKRYCGGIVGYLSGNKSYAQSIIGCLNTGNVTGASTSKTYTSAICAYQNGALLAQYNVSTGVVSGGMSNTALNWFNTATNNFNEATAHNYFTQPTVAFSYKGTNNEFENTTYATKVTAEQLASGEIAYALIQAGAEYGQLIGTDAYPVPASEYTVTKVGENYANVLKGNASDAEAYIQFSAVNSGKQSVRVLFCVKADKLATVDDMSIKVSITNTSGTKGATEKVTKYFSSVMASGYSWVAEDGYAIVGLVVNGVPELASGDNVSFELISGDGTNAAYNASASYTK